MNQTCVLGQKPTKTSSVNNFRVQVPDSISVQNWVNIEIANLHSKTFDFYQSNNFLTGYIGLKHTAKEYHLANVGHHIKMAYGIISACVYWQRHLRHGLCRPCWVNWTAVSRSLQAYEHAHYSICCLWRFFRLKLVKFLLQINVHRNYTNHATELEQIRYNDSVKNS